MAAYHSAMGDNLGVVTFHQDAIRKHLIECFHQLQFQNKDACLHGEIVGMPFSRKYRDPDAHIYVNIGIHTGRLFLQRGAHIYRVFGHPHAHIHVNMGIGVHIFA